jgi:hypothetical protein
MRKLLATATLMTLGATAFCQSNVPYGWSLNFYYSFAPTIEIVTFSNPQSLPVYDICTERNGASQPPSWNTPLAQLFDIQSTFEAVAGTYKKVSHTGNNIITQGWIFRPFPQEQNQSWLYPERDRTNVAYQPYNGGGGAD